MIFNKRKNAVDEAELGEVGALPNGAAQEPSYFGPDTVIEGTLYSDGEIHINGTMRGEVKAATCLVDAMGSVTGSIAAQYLVIRGRVLGPINAGQVSIQKGAHVEGNVMHDGLSIEHGAFVMGNITQVSHTQTRASLGPELEAKPLPALNSIVNAVKDAE